MDSISRRGLLFGSAGVLLSGCGVDTIERAAGNNAGRKVSGSFRSRAMRNMTDWTIAYPSGHGTGDALPVVVSLHGRGGDHGTTFSSLRLDSCLDQVVKAGTPPFAIASVDGGGHSYWHRRADGTDASAMVREEFLPLLEHRGLDTERLALFGWSMGGYGALLLAGKDKLPVRAVAVSSPALFQGAGRTPPGAFDDAADFVAHDVFDNPDWLSGVPAQVSCGDRDPFFTASRAFAARLDPKPAVSFGHGSHNAGYWRKVAPAQLRFVGKLLSDV